MSKILGYLLLVTLVLVGCQRTQLPSEVKSIEHLKAQLDSAIIVHDGIDTTGYRQFRKSYVSKLGFVEQTYIANGDTINRDLAFFLTEYRILKKPYRDFKAKYEQAEKDLIFTNEQLLTLKYAVEHNELKSKLVSDYILNETVAVNKIGATVKQLAISNTHTREIAVQLEMKMDSVIALLKNK